MTIGIRRLRTRLHRGEQGFFVVGFFLRLLLVMTLAGLAVEEGGQIVVAQIRAQGAARAAAHAAADAWASKHDLANATRVAKTAAAKSDEGAKVQSLTIDSEGIATVRVREVANTVVVQHVGFLAHFGVQRATETQGRSL
jgi:Flp pilus assembly protein TadG